MPSDGSPQHEPAEGLVEALARWDLGRVAWCEAMTGGSRSSPKMMVQAEKGRFVLKRRAMGRDEDERVAFAHAFIAVAAAAGVAVPLPVLSREARTWESMQGGVYEIFPLVEGVRWTRTPMQAKSAGDSLALLNAAALQMQWHGHVRAASFHGSLTVLAALQRLPKVVRAVDPMVDMRAISQSCESLAALYREASEQVEDLGYSALDSQVVHGDFHPGNVLFHGDQVAGVIDFDAARIEPAVVDFANALLQFTSRGGGSSAVACWPAELSADRFAAFCQGFSCHGDASMIALVEMVPALMMEACIAETTLPIAKHGAFGSVRAVDMLAFALRKVAWIREHAKNLHRRLRSSLA